jgi:hypothetical protein
MVKFVEKGTASVSKQGELETSEFNGDSWANPDTSSNVATDSQGRLRLAEKGVIITKGLLHYYNPDEIGVSTGSSVTTFPDTGSSSEDLSGGSPTYEANAMGSVDAPVYDATDDKLEAPNISNWQFLHDGSQSWEMFLVVQPSGSGGNDMTGSFGHIVGTMSFTRSDIGMVLGYDDRDGQGRDDVLAYAIGEGSSLVLQKFSPDGTLPKDTVSIINFRYDQSTDTYTGEVNGTEILSVSTTGQDGRDPTTTYTHGSPQGRLTNAFGGAIGDNPIYDRVLTSSERSNNYLALANKYGVTL